MKGTERPILIEGVPRTNTIDEERAMTSGTRSRWLSVTTFIAGFVSGIGAGIILAPQSGARTLRQLHNLASDLEEQTGHFIGDAKASLNRVIERGKRLAS
jgi:hypothetical protein